MSGKDVIAFFRVRPVRGKVGETLVRPTVGANAKKLPGRIPDLQVDAVGGRGFRTRFESCCLLEERHSDGAVPYK
jgi:hypothetical protein